MIDRIRALYPHLSIGVYALEPGLPLTVEVMTPDGTRYSRTAATAEQAFTAIFGPLPEAPAEETAQDERAPVVDPFD